MQLFSSPMNTSLAKLKYDKLLEVVLLN